MQYVHTREAKQNLIRTRFANLVGKKILSYEVAQLWCDDDQQWSDWMDLPLFLTMGEGQSPPVEERQTLSISWQKFDDLAIEAGRVLPFSLGGSTVRWRWEGLDPLESALGETIASVGLGRGQMSVGSSEIEIWTRLLIGLDNGTTLDLFNAFDETGINLTVLGPMDEVIVVVDRVQSTKR
ncbi:hypothetical protein C8B47_29475 [filamentous cyanobacterium CCP4]|nr:hypothetical protein C8B47_29475 [filamentous cyanobacterium CCP4]